jgi:hypothetical protein
VPPAVDEGLDHYAERIDSLVDRLDSLIEMQASRNHFVVTNKQEGATGLVAAAITACFLTYLSLIIFAVWNVIQISNLVSWEGVYGRDLSAIKQQINQHKP